MFPSRTDASLAALSQEWEMMGRSSDSSLFLIRVARQSDLNSLTDVLAGSFHSKDGIAGWMYPVLRMGIYEDLKNRLRFQAPQRVVCLVAVEHSPTRQEATFGGTADLTQMPIAGTVEVGLRSQQFWQPRPAHALYLSNLAVQHTYRRRGVARQLLAACDRIAVEWGYPEIYLHVLENNHAARQLYEKAGYQLKHSESSLGSLLFGQSRQLLLHKQLY